MKYLSFLGHMLCQMDGDCQSKISMLEVARGDGFPCYFYGIFKNIYFNKINAIKQRTYALYRYKGLEMIYKQKAEFKEEERMEKTNMNLKKIMIGVAIAIVVLGAGAFYLLSPVQYVSLDVNPSIEFKTNRMNRVVSMVGVNERGRTLLTDYQPKGQKLDVVLGQVVERMVDKGYVADTKINDILITTEKSSNSKKTLKNAGKTVQDELLKHDLSGDIIMQNIALDDATKKNAEEYEISAGKMTMIDKLMEHNSKLSATELAGIRISDLVSYAKKKNISLDSMEDHLETLQANGKNNAELRALEEAIDAEEDAFEDAEEQKKDAAEVAKDVAEKEAEKVKDAAELAEEEAVHAEEDRQAAAEEAEDAAKQAAEEQQAAAEEAEEAARQAEEERQAAAEERQAAAEEQEAAESESEE